MPVLYHFGALEQLGRIFSLLVRTESSERGSHSPPPEWAVIPMLWAEDVLPRSDIQVTASPGCLFTLCVDLRGVVDIAVFVLRSSHAWCAVDTEEGKYEAAWGGYGFYRVAELRSRREGIA